VTANGWQNHQQHALVAAATVLMSRAALGADAHSLAVAEENFAEKTRQ
jgi:hypothetical protein